MPQMYPMSWLLVFFCIEFMLMLSLFFMSNEILELESSGEDKMMVEGSNVVWEW